jgi:prepilin-type N-terminal cleavage/methylation domain-containing protein
MKPRPIPSTWSRRDGLTLLEILLSTAILAIVLLAIAATMSSMQNIWVHLREKSDQYRATRLAIDTVANRLSSATLAPRWTFDEKATGNSDKFVRDSDLHFVCGPADQLLTNGTYSGSAVFFQAPLGEHIEEKGVEPYDQRPAFLREHHDLAPERLRFRLMEFREPAHLLPIFQAKSNTETESKLSSAASQDQLYSWFREPIRHGVAKDRHVSVVADNVLAILLTPDDPGSDLSAPLVGADDVYDSRRFQFQSDDNVVKLSRNRLPPVLQLTVIAMSEDAWVKMTDDEIGSMASELRAMLVDRFKNAQSIEADLKVVEAELMRKKMPYRILTTKIKTNG